LLDPHSEPEEDIEAIRTFIGKSGWQAVSNRQSDRPFGGSAASGKTGCQGGLLAENHLQRLTNSNLIKNCYLLYSILQ